MLVELTDPNTGIDYSYSMDDKLYTNITKIVIPSLKMKDRDYVFVVDGEERSGKSTLAMQIGKLIDNGMGIDQICFSPTEFRNAIVNAKKGQCIIYDEAYRGLSSRGALSEVNRMLIGMMMEMGQKNLCVIVVLPTFFLLDRYVALWRAKVLIHVSLSKKYKGRRMFRVYNRYKKKELFLKGKKTFSYFVKSHFRGCFYGKYVIDEEEYRRKKAASLKEGFLETKKSKYHMQRDKILTIIYKQMGISQSELSKVLKEGGVQLTQQALSDIITQKASTPRLTQ